MRTHVRSRVSLTAVLTSIHHRTVLRALLLVVSLGGFACTKPVAGVCCVDSADCASLGVDDVRTCSDGLVCIDHECSVPPAGTCSGDGDCAAAAPHCSPQGTCVECTQSDQCPAAEPVCDTATNACRACNADSECDSTVCDTAAGACLAEAAIAYASAAGGDGAPCTSVEPCSITHAFAVTTPERHTVKLAPGDYVATLTVSNRTVIVHGSGATIDAPAGAAETIFISTSGKLELRDVIVKSSLSSAPALRCAGAGASVVLDGVDAQATTAGSFLSQGCTSTISRSHLRADVNAVFNVLANAGDVVEIDRTRIDGGGLIGSLGGGTLIRITNSLITTQESSTKSALGCRFGSGTSGAIFISFSTFANTQIACCNTVTCTGTSVSGFCIDNSIIANFGSGAPVDTVSGTGCIANYTLMFPQATSVAGANNKIGIDPQLLDTNNGDFHLKLTSPAIDAADPAATDAIDFDGVSRPQGAGRDIGAYEFKP